MGKQSTEERKAGTGGDKAGKSAAKLCSKLPSFMEGDFYGQGYTCEPAQVSCHGKLEFAKGLQTMADL